MSLTIDIGTSSVAPGNGGFRSFVPELPEGTDKQVAGFVRRLEIMKYAAKGQRTTLVESVSPNFCETPFSRMLERVARGIGARVIGGTSWCGIRYTENCERLCDFGLGGHEAQVLIIGGGFSPKSSPRDPQFPFISSSSTGCVFRLTEDLEYAGVQEKDLYWVNATDRLGSENDGSVLKKVPWKKIYALGAVARGWAEKQGFHPSLITKMTAITRWYNEEQDGQHPMVQDIQEVLG